MLKKKRNKIKRCCFVNAFVVVVLYIVVAVLKL